MSFPVVLEKFNVVLVLFCNDAYLSGHLILNKRIEWVGGIWYSTKHILKYRKEQQLIN